MNFRAECQGLKRESISYYWRVADYPKWEGSDQGQTTFVERDLTKIKWYVDFLIRIHVYDKSKILYFFIFCHKLNVFEKIIDQFLNDFYAWESFLKTF